MSLTAKQIMNKYQCDVFKDTGFDNSKKYWVAIPLEDNEYGLEYADGWTLKELEQNIKKQLKSLIHE